MFIARFIPVVDLQADENAEHDDDQIDRDCRPVLLLQMIGDAAQDHDH